MKVLHNKSSNITYIILKSSDIIYIILSIDIVSMIISQNIPNLILFKKKERPIILDGRSITLSVTKLLKMT